MGLLKTISNLVTDVRTAIAVADTPAVRRLQYAQLGDIRFEVVGPITGLEAKRAMTFAQHEVIEGKPRLQFTGDELEVLTLTLRFVDNFCDPVRAYGDLCVAAAEHAALPLVFAAGQVMGKYVISEIDDTTDRTDETGRITRRTTRVTLTEWVVSKELETKTQKAAAKTSAKAAVTAAPKVKKPRDPSQMGADLPEDVPTDVLVRAAILAPYWPSDKPLPR